MRGPSVTPGYEHDPAATAEAFRAGWFATGDLGRLDSDGYLFLVGRKKEQINRGGDKIAPIEVDLALAAHPAVEQAVAFAVPHATLGEDLAAAVVLKTPGEVSEAALLQALRRRLAPHKVPTRIVVLEALSVADTGKPMRSQVARELSHFFEDSVQSAAGPASGAQPATLAERFVAGIWQEVLDLPVLGRDDDCFALGATSLDVVEIAARLETELAETVHPPVIMTCRTVRDLARYLTRRYGLALARVLGTPMPRIPPSAPVDATARQRFRSLLRGRWPTAAVSGTSATRTKNPRAVFVLSAPRSGSTLLRAMLAGHAALFVPPEMRLLHFETLADWWRTHSGRHAFLREGLTRAWASQSGQTPSAAERALLDRAAEGLDIPGLFAEMQQRLAPRMLVDKTPLYAVDPTAMARMEGWFEEPLYIHLVRHPAAVVRSYTEAHMDQLWIGEQPFTSRQLAELLWLESQQQVLRHLRDVPRERCHRLDFESLVRHSEAAMRGLCAFLKLDYDPGMLRPYDDPVSRMTDGARPGSRAIGDPRFHSHRTIDATTADAWESSFDPSTLAEATLQQAAELGYDAGRGSTFREGCRHLSDIVRGWKGTRARPDSLIVGRNPGGSKRSLFWCLQSEEELSGLATQLGGEQPVFGMRSAHHAMVKTPQNLQALAALYAREIRQLDPVGPYCVGGNCQGAKVAFDVAHELLRGGAGVALLILMESFIERPYPGRVALIFGSESRRFNPYHFHPAPDAVWQDNYGEFSVDILSGQHGQFFRAPKVEVLAVTLNRCLAEV